MEYTTTRPEHTEVIKIGANCASCEAVCEARKTVAAIYTLGRGAIGSFTPGQRSMGREVSTDMKNCEGGQEAADQFLLAGRMDHGSPASRVRVMLMSAHRFFEASGKEGEFPEPRKLPWEVLYEAGDLEAALAASKVKDVS